MTKEKLKQKLRDKPGYLKSGSITVANLFNVSRRIAKQAIFEVKSELKRTDFDAGIKSYVEPATSTKEVSTRKEALEFVAKELISKGDLQGAIDILSQATKEEKKPAYKASTIKDGQYVVMGCTHLPFNHKEMWNSTCALIEDLENLQGVVLAGDILDMHSISRHSKGKIRLAGYTLEREYREANIELDKLDRSIGGRKILKEYFYGNHEDWYNAWGKDVDNAQLGGAGAKSPYDACFRHRGYNVQFNWKTAKVMLGDLEIIHGEWTNKHAAHKHASELHRNVAFFHTHRMGTYFESNIAGYNCGWGGDKTKDVFNYMSRPMKENWRNGILLVTVIEGKAYPQILDYNEKFLYNNKLY